MRPHPRSGGGRERPQWAVQHRQSAEEGAREAEIAAGRGDLRADEPAGQVRMFNYSPRGWRNVRDEDVALPALLRPARALTTLRDTPVMVLTAAGHEADPVWLAGRDRMAALLSKQRRPACRCRHKALLDEERGAASSVQAVDDVVRAVRAGTPLQ